MSADDGNTDDETQAEQSDSIADTETSTSREETTEAPASGEETTEAPGSVPSENGPEERRRRKAPTPLRLGLVLALLATWFGSWGTSSGCSGTRPTAPKAIPAVMQMVFDGEGKGLIPVLVLSIAFAALPFVIHRTRGGLWRTLLYALSIPLALGFATTHLFICAIVPASFNGGVGRWSPVGGLGLFLLFAVVAEAFYSPFEEFLHHRRTRVLGGPADEATEAPPAAEEAELEGDDSAESDDAHAPAESEQPDEPTGAAENEEPEVTEDDPVRPT